MMGVIIRARIRPAVKKLRPLTGPPNRTFNTGTGSTAPAMVSYTPPDLGGQHQDPPQSEHHRRHRRQQVDDVDHVLAQALGRQHGQEQGDADAHWHREDEGDGGDQQGAADEGQRAEDVDVGRPLGRGDEADALGLEGGPPPGSSRGR